MPLSSTDVEAAVRVLDNIVQVDRIMDLELSDIDVERDRKILLGRLSKACSQYIKMKHQKKARDRYDKKHGAELKCGLRQLRQHRLAHAGQVHATLEAVLNTPLLEHDSLKRKLKDPTESEAKRRMTYSYGAQELDLNLNQQENTSARSKLCYVCKKPYQVLHHFYDQLCRSCGDLNYHRRYQDIPLHSEQIALVTGGRIKIGFQIALKLLRAPLGGQVIITTRFPNDAAARYAMEEDYHSWKHKLYIYGLDFRRIKDVETFGQTLSRTLPRLDILINNAAQTIRRPDSCYQPLIQQEQQATLQWDTIAAKHGGIYQTDQPMITHESNNTVIEYDVDHQVVDRRPQNTWTDRLEDVSSIELLETMAINAAAPFILIRSLLPLMKQTSNPSFVINVTSMEGSFIRNRKTTAHPHTNGSKAFLDMVTFTSAADLQQHQVFMNGVDTGWVTNENPSTQGERSADSWQPPLDEVDGAARVLDPIVQAMVTGKHTYGNFYKDYQTYSPR